jgi:pimeloyl-ACP methyl ester carboxylesterase
MSCLSIASFAAAVLIVGPGLLARSAHGAEIVEVVEAARSDAPAMAPARVHSGADLRVDEFFVHVPAGAHEPLTALVVLHGMGGSGEDISRPLLERADAERWVLVAPTFQYGDWRDPAQLTREAGVHMPRIAAFLDRLPELTGLTVRQDALFYGFSRGGQTANRFALCYPDRVAGVAMVSSGTYTLPFESSRSTDGDVAMPFPYGVSNLADLFGGRFDSSRFAGVPFWVAVGSRDSDPADVPQQWSRYLGDDRVERAERFAGSLREAGFKAEVTVFPGVGHGETDQIRTAALDFLKGALSG